MWQGKKCGAGASVRNAGSGDMTPPRSLGRSRSCRSAAAGVAGI